MTTEKKARAAGAPAITRATAIAAPARRRRRAPKQSAPDHATIAERAYFLSLTGGADPLRNWLQAERELAA